MMKKIKKNLKKLKMEKESQLNLLQKKKMMMKMKIMMKKNQAKMKKLQPFYLLEQGEKELL
jgi:hypothetical protein